MFYNGRQLTSNEPQELLKFFGQIVYGKYNRLMSLEFNRKLDWFPLANTKVTTLRLGQCTPNRTFPVST